MATTPPVPKLLQSSQGRFCPGGSAPDAELELPSAAGAMGTGTLNFTLASAWGGSSRSAARPASSASSPCLLFPRATSARALATG
eukprot:2630033-Pyramimonas_sp.AAC.1